LILEVIRYRGLIHVWKRFFYFLRISKFFENNLDKDQWHQSLLNYDWGKLMFLLKKFENVKDRVKKYYIVFDNFLWSLVKKMEQ